jgi:ADP-heptose:LPS heptosyltransferase
VGLGDQIMATGLARGARKRGKRIAFGDGERIRWDHHSAQIFKGNPNIALPGQERHRDVEWVKFYKGHRIYNTQDGDRWVWHPEKFKAKPGELFLTDLELAFAAQFGSGFVVIEPNVPEMKTCAPNKRWPVARYEAVSKEFAASGYKVVQFGYHGARHRLQHAQYISPPTFRHALAILKNARIAILPEGGLHHGAAAVGTKAVVLFGGFIPPSVTGYDMHANLTGGAEACGSLNACPHCAAAMDAIRVDDVLGAADGMLG